MRIFCFAAMARFRLFIRRIASGSSSGEYKSSSVPFKNFSICPSEFTSRFRSTRAVTLSILYFSAIASKSAFFAYTYHFFIQSPENIPMSNRPVCYIL